MINTFVENIKNFMDVYVFFMILGIGIFELAIDYPYFKKKKYEKDKKTTLIMGMACVIGSFALAILSRLG